MKDTLLKLRALVSMKTTLIHALQEDLATAHRRMYLLEIRVTEAEKMIVKIERENPWWKPLDDEMGRIEQKERDYGECGVGKEYFGYEPELDNTLDIPFSIKNKETS